MQKESTAQAAFSCPFGAIHLEDRWGKVCTVKNHAAQFGNSGAGGRRLLKSNFPRPRAEGSDGGSAKPGDARRMQAYLIRRTPPQSRGPGKGGMKARKISNGRNFSCFRLPTSPAAFWLLCRRGQSNSPRRAKYPALVPPSGGIVSSATLGCGGPKGPPYLSAAYGRQRQGQSPCPT